MGNYRICNQRDRNNIDNGQKQGEPDIEVMNKMYECYISHKAAIGFMRLYGKTICRRACELLPKGKDDVVALFEKEIMGLIGGYII